MRSQPFFRRSCVSFARSRPSKPFSVSRPQIEHLEPRLLLTADLVSSMSLDSLGVVWGDSISYTADVTASAPLEAGQSYNAYLKLSADNTIDASDYIWASVTGQTVACSFTSPRALPSSAPAGIPIEGMLYVGVLIEPNFGQPTANDTAQDSLVVSRTDGFPVITGISPADDGTSVAVNTDFVITWSKAVGAGGGDFQIHRASDGLLIAAVNSWDPPIAWDGNQCTINLPGNLESDTEYYILLLGDGFARSEADGYYSTDVTEATFWDFRTAPLPVLGDVTLDGRVDAADYIRVKCNMGLVGGAGLSDGDVDGNGDVDLGDIQALVANIGTSHGAAHAAKADAVAELELLTAPVADAPDSNVLAIAAGRQIVPLPTGRPACSLSPLSGGIGPRPTCVSPLPSFGRSGQMTADVFQLAAPWWSGNSAKHKIEPRTVLDTDIDSKLLKGPLEPTVLDALGHSCRSRAACWTPAH
jgi:hypothetical protein